MKQELDIRPIISDDRHTVGGQRNLFCPVCGCINSHVEPPSFFYGAQWDGNGALAVTPLWSECGSKWEVCIGFHKGDAPIFVRVKESCKKEKGENDND